jgi:hypothetical protein
MKLRGPYEVRARHRDDAREAMGSHERPGPTLAGAGKGISSAVSASVSGFPVLVRPAIGPVRNRRLAVAMTDLG